MTDTQTRASRAPHSELTSPPLSPTLQHWLDAQGYPAEAIDAAGENRMTPLMRASRAGDADIVEELLACGAAIAPVNSDGNNALWLACYSGNADIIQRLIQAGINMDHQNDNGATCLMYAASSGKGDVLQHLLAAGADGSLTSLDGFTALDMAATEECLRLLRRGTPSGR